MSTIDESTERDFAVGDETRIAIELTLEEAEQLRTWLLKANLEGTSSLDDPLLSSSLTKLARAVDTVRATVNVRRELEQAGLSITHLSDDQVRELGRRVSEAALPAIRA